MTTFVEKIAQKCGRYVSYAEPLLDGTLPDGSRVNATYTTDVSSRGPTFSIRKFTKEPWSPLQLVQKGTTSLEILAYAWMCIEYEHSFMVVGGTGSGKTSLLNCLAFFIPPQARIVSIEDTRELQLSHENWLPSVSRACVGISNLIGQKYGEVSLFDLLKASFRQRPDYIIVGEIRGKEAYVLFQAFASGHPGCATMHAENVGTMIRRLETPPINLSGSMLMTLSTVFTIEQTKVRGKDVRKVTSVDEIIDVQEHLKGFKTNNVFKWDPTGEAFRFNIDSKVFEKIAIHYGFTKEDVMKEYQVRVALLRALYNRGIIGFKEVQDVIHQYYKTPQIILKKYGLIK
jgi:flagellar protein FlaI